MYTKEKKKRTVIGLSVLSFLLTVMVVSNITFAGREPAEPNDRPKVIPKPQVNPKKVKAKEKIKPIKEAFNNAMAKPLYERVGLLEGVAQSIGEDILSGKLSGHGKTLGLYYKFHAQLQQAKYLDSYKTYADYIKNIKEVENVQEAKAVFLRGITTWKRKRDYAFCALLCDKVVDELAGEADLAATAVYYKAYCKFRMNGTMGECVELCNKLIADYPESNYRPLGMRMLANAYMAQGKHKDALSILSLLKQQYKNTQWEHYADMRPGIVYEIGKGDPQKALDVYIASLGRYPDHMYGPYIQKQVKRLQKIIEEQLILDAIKDIAKSDNNECKAKSVIVKSDSANPKQVATKL